jgi:hypothetical protein
MSNPSQPYKLGAGKGVGDAAAKAGAEIGTAISQGVQAVSGVKKHRNALEHIASENALNREHVKTTATHYAGIAKELGGKTKIESDSDGAVRFSSKTGKNKKNKNKNLSSAQQEPGSAVGTRQGTGSFRAPGTPKSVPRGSGAGVRSGAVVRPSAQPTRALPPGKPETKPANATVKPMLALPPGKSDSVKAANSDKMKTFTEKKKARGITGGPKAPKSGVAGRKLPSTRPTIIESLDQSRETTNKNVDKAWAYVAARRAAEKRKANKGKKEK